MRNKLKVKDIRRLTGLTGAEIAWFHHQKIVRASGYSNYSVEGHDGYKEFDRRDLPKFQQIAMYYDLGLRRNEIRDIMQAKDYDCGRALDELYVQLKEKRDRLERHMIAIEHLRMIGTKGNVLDYLRGSSMETLGENYQLLQNSSTWAEMRTQFLQMPTEPFEQQIITCAQNLAALSDEALKGEAGASAISALVETMTGNLGLMGYILMMAIPAGILGEGTMADDVPAMLGAELSEAQARAIMKYLEADLDRAYSEIIDIIVQYHSFFGGEYDSEEIRAMADAAKVVAKTYFGISQEIEYRLLFELLPPKPVKHEKDYLNYLYNALYHYHRKETQKLQYSGGIIMADFTCWNCGRPTTYEGEGYWHCSKCRTSFYEGYDEDGNPDGGDRLSVSDAAQIWASHGKDEDYTFGYSEDELEDAL